MFAKNLELQNLLYLCTIHIVQYTYNTIYI